MNDAYDEGWSAGYNDLQPECPYQYNTQEYVDWWLGYEQGSQDC